MAAYAAPSHWHANDLGSNRRALQNTCETGLILRLPLAAAISRKRVPNVGRRERAERADERADSRAIGGQRLGGAGNFSRSCKIPASRRRTNDESRPVGGIGGWRGRAAGTGGRVRLARGPSPRVACRALPCGSRACGHANFRHFGRAEWRAPRHRPAAVCPAAGRRAPARLRSTAVAPVSVRPRPVRTEPRTRAPSGRAESTEQPRESSLSLCLRVFFAFTFRASLPFLRPSMLRHDVTRAHRRAGHAPSAGALCRCRAPGRASPGPVGGPARHCGSRRVRPRVPHAPTLPPTLRSSLRPVRGPRSERCVPIDPRFHAN